jgi:hypothetical protein
MHLNKDMKIILTWFDKFSNCCNQKISLELSVSKSWSGALGIGITTNNPSKIKPSDLPRFAFRNLGEKEGYWLKAVSENLLSEGSKVTVYLSAKCDSITENTFLSGGNSSAG